MPRRVEQVNELIHHELSRLFLRELEFKKGTFVTIARVETDNEMKHATVHISVYPFSETHAALSLLTKRKSFIQSLLIKRLVMHFVPALSYVADSELEYVDEIDRLLFETHAKQIPSKKSKRSKKIKE